MIETIRENNKTHVVDEQELQQLITQAQETYRTHFASITYFERSVFTNWTCAIADCKYCYLSTKPKHTPGSELKALRSQASILAEILVCRAMGWRIGYITGGLRVESTDYLIDLLDKIMARILPHLCTGLRHILQVWVPLLSRLMNNFTTLFAPPNH